MNASVNISLVNLDYSKTLSSRKRFTVFETSPEIFADSIVYTMYVVLTFYISRSKTRLITQSVGVIFN